jgi:hypothetical protein
MLLRQFYKNVSTWLCPVWGSIEIGYLYTHFIWCSQNLVFLTNHSRTKYVAIKTYHKVIMFVCTLYYTISQINNYQRFEFLKLRVTYII